MGQATVTAAEATLAGLSGLSDQQRAAYKAEVDAARQAAIAAGEGEAERIAAEVAERREPLLQELCEVRDALAAAKAADDREALSRLRSRYRTALAAVEEVEHLAEQVEAVEADPFFYGDTLFGKYSHIRPNFSFL